MRYEGWHSFNGLHVWPKYTPGITQHREFTIQSLSEDDEAPGTSSGAIVVVDEAIGAAPLGKSQAQFNKLIERLRGQRLDLERWQAFRRMYQQQLASDYEPLAVKLREKRIAMVKVLDRAMDVESLGRREQKKVREILGRLLPELLAEGEDAELIRIHDRYAHMSFGDERRARSELLKQVASDEYGIDVGGIHGWRVARRADGLAARTGPCVTGRARASEQKEERQGGTARGIAGGDGRGWHPCGARSVSGSS